MNTFQALEILDALIANPDVAASVPGYDLEALKVARRTLRESLDAMTAAQALEQFRAALALPAVVAVLPAPEIVEAEAALAEIEAELE